MRYFVTWLNADRVIAEQAFDDVFAARDHLFEHRQEYATLGATGGRVSDGRATYFQVEWASES